MALMAVKSMYGQAGERNVGLVGKRYLGSLLRHDRVLKDTRKFLANIDKPSPLYASLRIIAGNASEHTLLALAPFMPHMPCAPTRRKAMNKLINLMTSTVVSVDSQIRVARMDEGDAAAMAEEAQCPAEEEEELTDAELAGVGGWDGAREAGDGSGALHELDEMATATCDAPVDGGSYGLGSIDDGPALMLPLLMMDSCVRRGHVSAHVTARLTCDAAVVKHVGIIKGDQHVTTCITQMMGNGAPGTVLAQQQFRGNMRSARALVNRVGRGPDKLPWLTRNHNEYLRQVAAANIRAQQEQEQQFSLLQRRAPLQRDADGNWVWHGPKADPATAPAAEADLAPPPPHLVSGALAGLAAAHLGDDWVDALFVVVDEVGMIIEVRALGCRPSHTIPRTHPPLIAPSPDCRLPTDCATPLAAMPDCHRLPVIAH